MQENIALFIVLLAVSLLAAAFFSSAETAFISVQKVRVHHLALTAGRSGELVARITAHPEKLLATVLLGINFFESAVAALGTVLAVLFLGENWGLAVATLAITLLTLVLAEFIPKSMAARFGERLALAYARPMELVMAVFSPFVFVLNHVGLRFTRLIEEETPRPTMSEAEFRTAVSVGEAEGVLEEAQADMIHKVFEFGDRPVREAMTPRTEIAFVRKGSPLSEFIAMYPGVPHSRFPVYEETLDNVVGILSIKDVLIAQAGGAAGDETPVDGLVRPALFVPESKRLGELLAQMQREGQQVAVVIDEFGGTAGIVTMEQMMEEIVGSIGDELASGAKEYETVGENAFLVDGGLRIDDANEELGLGLPEGDYETVAGLILHLLGRIPREGERLTYKGLKVQVSEMKGNKIERVLFTREAPAREGVPGLPQAGGPGGERAVAPARAGRDPASQ